MDRKQKIVIITAVVLSIAAMAVGCYLFCLRIPVQLKIEKSDAPLYALIPIYVFLVALGALIDQIIHEGAHLFVGVICSMGVKAPRIRLFSSSSVDIYPKGKKHMKARMIATCGAGLFFELLVIILGIVSLCVPTVFIFFCVLLPYALYSFIVNVAPVEYSSGKTDGLVLWELFTNKPTAQVLLAILRIQGSVHAGTLMSELDEGMLLDVPQLPEDDINFIILTQLRYEYYLATGNDPEAYKYFCRYRDLIQYLPDGYTGKDKSKKDMLRAKRKMKAEEKLEAEEMQEEAASPAAEKTAGETTTPEAEETAEGNDKNNTN